LTLGLVLVVGLAADGRRAGPEAVARQYFADLEAQRLEDALAALSPAAVERWGDFVRLQQSNRYEVVSVAVRSPSLLESLTRGRAWQPNQLTLVVEVREPSDLRWRGSTLVPVARRPEGGWALERPPFAQD
jgi:hypothetical protein